MRARSPTMTRRSGSIRASRSPTRTVAARANGDLDGALADINEAIRINPQLPFSFISRGVTWRAKGEYDRAIADYDEAVRLTRAGAPVPTLTPRGSLLINAYAHRGLAHEAKGDFARAKADFSAALAVTAVDAGSRESQATARARLAVLSGAGDAPPQPATPAGGDRRMALVIGNGAYGSLNRLPNPPNDARSVARSLREMGFDVSEGLDLDRAAMKKLVIDFLRAASGARLAIFYFAGHGMQVEGKNYLLPTDARLDAARDLADELADLDTILAGLDDQIRTNIVILDACRDNPLVQRIAAAAGAAPAATRSVTVGAGLAAPSALGAGATRGAGTLIAFATAPGQVALDGAGDNSPFSSALMRHIGTPGLEVQQMLTRVRADVVAATGGKQVPWSNSSLLGEVFLLAAKPKRKRRIGAFSAEVGTGSAQKMRPTHRIPFSADVGTGSAQKMRPTHRIQ